ncbi:MAG: alpha/beta fold hydrolase [bacterium]
MNRSARLTALRVVAIRVALALFVIACAMAAALSARPARADEATRDTAGDLANPLPRRGFFGAVTAAMPADERTHLGFPDTAGVVIQSVVEGAGAARAGLQAEDVILTVDGAGVATPGQLALRMAGRKPGDKVAIAYSRASRRRVKSVELTEAPREASAEYDIVYGSITSRAGRQRTIITKPKSPGPHPAFFIIQGIGAFTMERGPGGAAGYAAIIEDFAARGFVTLRVDKPGCGDSEGGPLKDVDFDTQLDGFRHALAMLRSDPDVDRDRILIFGHSMGGVWGPLLATEMPVRGIAVYGTVAKTWVEYTFENNRRQAALGGATAAEIDTLIRQEAIGNYFLCEVGMTPDELATARPEMSAWVDSTFVERKYSSGLHYNFLRQLNSKNLAAAWEAFPGWALAVWGRSDFISGEADHALVAQIVNARNAGRGEFVVLENSDHGFYEAMTFEESIANWGKPGRRLNPAIVETLRAWSEKVARN